MRWFLKKQPRISIVLVAFTIIQGFGSTVIAQRPSEIAIAARNNGPKTVEPKKHPDGLEPGVNASSPALSHYFDPQQGTSANDLVRRGVGSNGELAGRP